MLRAFEFLGGVLDNIDQSLSEPDAPSKEERNWGLLCHLSSLSGYAVGIGFIVGPLVVWLIKKDDLPFVDDQGKEAVNFNLSLLIYAVIGIVIALVTLGIGLIIAIPLWIGIVIVHLVFTIIANNGVAYRYPLSFRLVK